LGSTEGSSASDPRARCRTGGEGKGGKSYAIHARTATVIEGRREGVIYFGSEFIKREEKGGEGAEFSHQEIYLLLILIAREERSGGHRWNTFVLGSVADTYEKRGEGGGS